MKGICKFCRTEFEKQYSQQRYCSGACRRKMQYKRQKNNLLMNAVCKHCGKPFNENFYRRDYCSVECSRRAQLNRRNNSYVKKKEQLCWFCKNACGGCSWSRSFVPIAGWEAYALERDNGTIGYRIRKCPEFIPDE